jgi:hypothetical protein
VSARADTVTLANGSDILGVVVRQTKKEIRVKIGPGGFVDLDASTVAKVKRDPKKDNMKLLDQWRKQELEDREADEAQNKFEDEQHKKGLVLYNGAWVDSDELAKTPPEPPKRRPGEQRAAAQAFVPGELQAAPPVIVAPEPTFEPHLSNKRLMRGR